MVEEQRYRSLALVYNKHLVRTPERVWNTLGRMEAHVNEVGLEAILSMRQCVDYTGSDVPAHSQDADAVDFLPVEELRRATNYTRNAPTRRIHEIVRNTCVRPLGKRLCSVLEHTGPESRLVDTGMKRHQLPPLAWQDKAAHATLAPIKHKTMRDQCSDGYPTPHFATEPIEQHQARGGSAYHTAWTIPGCSNLAARPSG